MSFPKKNNRNEQEQEQQRSPQEQQQQRSPQEQYPLDVSLFVEALKNGGLYSGIFKFEPCLLILEIFKKLTNDTMQRTLEICRMKIETTKNKKIDKEKSYVLALKNVISKYIGNMDNEELQTQHEQLHKYSSEIQQTFGEVIWVYISETKAHTSESAKITVQIPSMKDFIYQYYKFFAREPFVIGLHYFDSSKIIEREICYMSSIRMALKFCLDLGHVKIETKEEVRLPSSVRSISIPHRSKPKHNVTRQEEENEQEEMDEQEEEEEQKYEEQRQRNRTLRRQMEIQAREEEEENKRREYYEQQQLRQQQQQQFKQANTNRTNIATLKQKLKTQAKHKREDPDKFSEMKNALSQLGPPHPDESVSQLDGNKMHRIKRMVNDNTYRRRKNEKNELPQVLSTPAIPLSPPSPTVPEEEEEEEERDQNEPENEIQEEENAEELEPMEEKEEQVPAETPIVNRNTRIPTVELIRSSNTFSENSTSKNVNVVRKEPTPKPQTTIPVEPTPKPKQQQQQAVPQKEDMQLEESKSALRLGFSG